MGARFKKNDAVIFRPTLEMGQIAGDPILDGGEYWYRVRFVARAENIPEDDLESLGDELQSVQSLAQAGRWGRVRSFRCALAVERITNINQTTLYSFNAQRILFEAYQYKPLLKLIESPDRRLLIADEVGLGNPLRASRRATTA